MTSDDILHRIKELPPEKRAAFEEQLAACGLHPFALSSERPGIPRRSRQARTSARGRTSAGVLKDLPTVLTASYPAEKLSSWLPRHRALIDDRLRRSGAILFRNFQIDGPEMFEDCIDAIAGPPIDYPGIYQGTAVRKHVYGKIYTSTELSPEFRLHLHSESSFAHSWPFWLFFFCVRAANRGGETPLADTRSVLQRLSPSIRTQFEERGVMYVRNYGIGTAASWQSTFNTDNRGEVERFCRGIGVSVEWLGRNRLRTRSVRPALMKHPLSGETVWFNHVNSAHVWSNEPVLRDALLAEFEPQDLPRTCFFGDGGEIDADTLEAIRAAYQEEASLFKWEAGDLLLLDNMLTAHGREPYVGERRVLVGMAGTVKRNPSDPLSSEAEIECEG